MSRKQESAEGAELTEQELNAVRGGSTIIQGDDKRVPEGVTFKPKEPSRPKPLVIPLPWPWRPFTFPQSNS